MSSPETLVRSRRVEVWSARSQKGSPWVIQGYRTINRWDVKDLPQRDRLETLRSENRDSSRHTVSSIHDTRSLGVRRCSHGAFRRRSWRRSINRRRKRISCKSVHQWHPDPRSKRCRSSHRALLFMSTDVRRGTTKSEGLRDSRTNASSDWERQHILRIHNFF